MAKRAAAVKATATTKKAVGTNSRSSTANGASKATAEAPPKIVTAEVAAAPNSVNTTQERRVCLRCNGPLTDDDLEMERGHCEACRDMSRRVARWVRDEELKAAYPEEYRDKNKKKLSLRGRIWKSVAADIDVLVNEPTFTRDPELQSSCELLVDWLARRLRCSEEDVYWMTWEEVHSLLRKEVKKIKAAKSARRRAKADGHQSGTEKPSEPQSTDERDPVEPPDETVVADSSRATEAAPEVEKSPANEIESPYLDLSGISLDGEVRRKGYEKPVDLSGKKVLRKLYTELFKVRDNPIPHKRLARILGMDERTLSSNIGRFKDEFLIVDVKISSGRNHMLIDCRDA